MLTNEIYKTFKNIRKESLRDNMTDIEVILTDLGEVATKELAKKHKPKGLNENKKIARKGGMIAKNIRNDFERELKRSVIDSSNNLNNKYLN